MLNPKVLGDQLYGWQWFVMLDFYARIPTLPLCTVSNTQHLNAKFGSVVNVHVSIRNISVRKWKLLLQKMFTQFYSATQTLCSSPCQTPHKSRWNQPRGVQSRALKTHIAEMWNASHYEGQACRNTPLQVYLITREQNRKPLGWWIHTMSSVAEPLNDRGADGLN